MLRRERFTRGKLIIWLSSSLDVRGVWLKGMEMGIMFEYIFELVLIGWRVV